MNIIINCKHMDLTQTIKDYAEGKIGRFSKYLASISEAVVTLSVEKYRHTAEVQLHVNGSVIKAESTTGELYSSIDGVVEKLARQVKKIKDKNVAQRKNKDRSTATFEKEENAPAIIRNKSYDIKPMSIDEASMQMDLLDRNFFVFTNASSGDINVLYKRTDGNFGLIEPVK